MRTLFTLLLGTSLFMVVLTGCVTRMGSKEMQRCTQEQIQSRIIDGKTRMEDVIVAFGDSFTVSVDSYGREVWRYSYKKSYLGNAIHATHLTVLFDKEGVVKKHSFYSTHPQGK